VAQLSSYPVYLAALRLPPLQMVTILPSLYAAARPVVESQCNWMGKVNGKAGKEDKKGKESRACEV